jgi:hypothetical protein
MLEQYFKLFDISLLKPWIIEAVVIMAMAFILAFVVCKVIECYNKSN